MACAQRTRSAADNAARRVFIAVLRALYVRTKKTSSAMPVHANDLDPEDQVGMRPVHQAFRNGADLRTGLGRSEEHTSELQSLMRISYAVFCLKKKTRSSTKDL